jgi:hypothetical protein
MEDFRLEIGAQLLQDGTYRPVVGCAGRVFWEAGGSYESHSAAVNKADSALRGALASLLARHEETPG